MAKESLDTAVNLLYVNSIGTLENIMAKLNWQKLYTQSKEQSKRERSYDPTHSMTRRCDIKLADKQAKQDRLIRNKAMASIKAHKG